MIEVTVNLGWFLVIHMTTAFLVGLFVGYWTGLEVEK